MKWGLRISIVVVVLALAGAASASAAPLQVTWMPGFKAPGTPAKYNRVGVIKVGSAKAKNVLVLEPGTSAAAAYFVPLAKWIVVDRAGVAGVVGGAPREPARGPVGAEPGQAGQGLTDEGLQLLPRLPDQPERQARTSRRSPTRRSRYAKAWGMNVAVEDLHRVIAAAHKLGGKVVLGGHSLGGSVVTAYATWNFGGQPGADGLAGLVFIDGGSFPARERSGRAGGAHRAQRPERDAVARIRRDRGSVRRPVQRHGRARRAPGSEHAVARAAVPRCSRPT